MAYAEAIAHGLPVIGTTAGAIPDTVPAAAGVLVPPDDVAALAAALRRLIAQPAERERLAAGARAAAARASDLARIGRTVRAGHREGVMSGFSSSWLTLREPYDRRARNGAVLDAVRGLGRRTLVGGGGRSRLRARLDPARRHRKPAAAAKLAAGRQRSEPARPRRRPRAPARPDRDGRAGRSRARPRSGARRPGRAGHHLGAARSRVA